MSDRDTIERLEAENAKLRAIVDRLPVTADGVRVVPDHDSVWVSSEKGDTTEPCESGYIERGLDGVWYVMEAGPSYADVPVSDCYSTREAAEAAMGGGG